MEELFINHGNGPGWPSRPLAQVPSARLFNIFGSGPAFLNVFLAKGNFCFMYLLGNYDGNVYVLNRHDGKVVWTFSTRGQVKSSPCVDPLTGLVYIGSHDQNLYALDVIVSGPVSVSL